MVCLGNICRSPMAEGIMRSKITNYHLNAIVDSCGTADYHIGDSPDRRAQQTLRKNGADISNLKGRQFEISDFDKFDRIFAMDENNYFDLISLARNDMDKSKVEMIMNQVYPNENIPVPDPYYGGMEGFDNTYKMLDLACENISTQIKTQK